MKYVFSLLWAVVIGTVVSYVLTSMANEPFNLTLLFILAGLLFIATIIIDAVLNKASEN